MRGSSATVALSVVAFLFAFVEPTVESFLAYFTTRVGRSTAVNNVSALAAKAGCHFLLLAGLARTSVAILLAFVFLTIQYFLTLFSALEGSSFFATFCHSLAFSALTRYYHAFVFTRSTFTLVADIGTRMCAVRSSFFVADLSTGMRG